MVSAYPDAATMIPDVFAPDEEGPIPTGRAYNLDQEEVEI